MALRLTLGQYFEADSPIHALDPRVKIVSAVAIMLAVFFIQTPLQLAVGFAGMMGVLALSRIPVAKIFEALKPVIVILLVLGIFNLVFTRTGDTLIEAGPLIITTGGVRAAFLFSLRLVIGVLAGLAMLLTTTPTQLTDAFDSLLSPASALGLPGHELAMVFSLMLRFIPTLADEAQAVIDAQTARGGALAEGSFVHRVKSVGPILIALLASSLHHANGLSRALDARCYEGGAARSHWHPLKLRAQDGVAALAAAAFVAAIIALGFV